MHVGAEMVEEMLYVTIVGSDEGGGGRNSFVLGARRVCVTDVARIVGVCLTSRGHGTRTNQENMRTLSCMVCSCRWTSTLCQYLRPVEHSSALFRHVVILFT